MRRIVTGESASGTVMEASHLLDAATTHLVTNIWGFDQMPELPLPPRQRGRPTSNWASWPEGRGPRQRPYTASEKHLNPAGDSPLPNREGNKMPQLKNKIAVVTGGSSGIGLATAKRFVEEGASVFIAGRRQAELDKAVAEIGSNVTGVKTDISKLDDLDRLYETVAKKGKIDVIFAGAAFVEKALTPEATPEHFDKTFNTNARGTYFTVQKALPHLNDGASIILVASAGKNKGIPGRSTYSASKAALRSFARTWTNELKGRKIRANVLSPASVETPCSTMNSPRRTPPPKPASRSLR